MCYATKKKIADCVKTLMRHKEISRITIQDIMDETHMSRQSFYYHFKDIYDVLEWIGLNDFKEQLTGDQYDDLASWGRDLMRVLCAQRAFYEKIAREIEWPRITRCVKGAMRDQIYRLFAIRHEELYWNHTEQIQAYADFLATSICYYMLDYVYDHKNLSEEKIENDIQFMLWMVDRPEMRTVTMIPKSVAM